MRSRRAVSFAGQDAQVVGLQDRIDRGEERRRLAGLAASTATAVTVAATGVVGLGAAVDRGGAERRVLVALAIAAAARKHALCLPRAADVGAAGDAALRACRSEERRVGKEGVRQGNFRGAPENKKK